LARHNLRIPAWEQALAEKVAASRAAKAKARAKLEEVKVLVADEIEARAAKSA